MAGVAPMVPADGATFILMLAKTARRSPKARNAS
jgi:hypothetical protein